MNSGSKSCADECLSSDFWRRGALKSIKARLLRVHVGLSLSLRPIFKKTAGRVLGIPRSTNASQWRSRRVVPTTLKDA